MVSLQGVDVPQPRPRHEGPATHAGRLLWDDFSKTVRASEGGLRGVIYVLIEGGDTNSYT